MLVGVEIFENKSKRKIKKANLKMVRFARKIAFVSANLPRMAIWLFLGLLRLLGIRLFDYLFFISPGTNKNLRDIDQYCPRKLSKSWVFSEARNLFVAIIKKSDQCGRGLVVGTFKTTEDFLKNKQLGAKFEKTFKWLQLFTGVKSIALAGQMPGLINHQGVKIKKPVVSGIKGTVFCVSKTVKRVIIKHGLIPGKFQIAIVGVGRIGGSLMDNLKEFGHNVVGIDIKARGHSIALTEDASKILPQADMVVVLTPDGRDFIPYIKYLKNGAIVIDDTHPRIRADVGKVFFYKVAVELPGVEFFPQLPGYWKNWIPGCVVEAMFVAATNRFNGVNQKQFNQRVEEFGFRALLVK